MPYSKIPELVRDRVSDRAAKTIELVAKFVEEECIPADAIYEAQLGVGKDRWTQPPIVEHLKERAKELGLWNMFLAKGHYKEGAGFTNLEYGLMAEHLGKSRTASEATNNAAPDTGNMELLAKYGTEAQKKQWLAPLLAGEIRSAYVMTEPNVASSDASNVQISIRREHDEWVINGQKWWISSAGDPRCKLYIILGKTDPTNPDRLKQQSIILVPSNTPGITVKRMLSVYGYDDAPHGHGHLFFNNVRVPASSVVLGPGRGFEVMQGRMGPGRIHHAMRLIGSAEKALDWMLARANDPRKQPFGKQLSEQGVILDWIATSRIDIDAARFIVLNAAAMIDSDGAKTALTQIAEAKILVPSMALKVIDRAVQTYGGEGICQDTPLAYMWAQARTVRLADGPDEAHVSQLGKRENRRAREVIERLAKQEKKVDELFRKYGAKDLKATSRL